MQAHIVTDGQIRTTRVLDEILQALRGGLVIWIDLEERTPDADRVLEAYGIHPMAAEDIWVDRAVPKVEEFDEYLNIEVHGASHAARPTSVEIWSLNIVLGQTSVVTYVANPKVRPKLARCIPHLLEGPARVAHALLDEVIDGLVALTEDFGTQVDELRHQVLALETSSNVRAIAAQLFDLRRSMQKLARVSRRQLDALSGLYQGRFKVIPTSTLPYFRDIYDHFVGVSDLVDDYREQIDNALDALTSVQSARMNSVMKTLTVLSTVTLPLSLVAGIFGMNYRLPGQQSSFGFLAALMVMGVAGLSLIAIFRRRGWI
jgi:magnesium transporter